ncbi:MAG: hypothetical protein IT385_21970 [Deltaproteobacteria bacterium]|nr:hypothetical protein [Deltaproteobacteria bacterium]
MSIQNTIQKAADAVHKALEEGKRRQLRASLGDPDPEVRRANGALFRARIAQHEVKLTPELWQGLVGALDRAIETGDVAPLEAAVDAADAHIKAHRATPPG